MRLQDLVAGLMILASAALLGTRVAAQSTQASKALDLAQARYKLGFSEIVALSQAQLNKTQAEIAEANARYDYLKELAILAYETGQIR